MRRTSLSSTVLPTPRSPVSIRLFSGRPINTRPSKMRACSRIGARPANSGGGEPAPGEKGFLIGSIFYPVITSSSNILLELDRTYPRSHLKHLQWAVAAVDDHNRPILLVT